MNYPLLQPAILTHHEKRLQRRNCRQLLIMLQRDFLELFKYLLGLLRIRLLLLASVKISSLIRKLNSNNFLNSTVTTVLAKSSMSTILDSCQPSASASLIIGSGATDYMTSSASLFTYCSLIRIGKFRIADGSFSMISGNGNIKISKNFTLDSVLQVPILDTN